MSPPTPLFHSTLALIVREHQHLGTTASLTPKQLRVLLGEHDARLVWTAEEWKVGGGREGVRGEAERLLNFVSSPIKPEPEEEHKVVKKGGGGKDKYDRMSEKNLQKFLAMTGMSGGGAGAYEDEEEEEEDGHRFVDDTDDEAPPEPFVDEEEEDAPPPAPVEEKPTKGKGKEKRESKTKPSEGFKSRSTISDSDDEGEGGASGSGGDGSASATRAPVVAPKVKKPRAKKEEKEKKEKVVKPKKEPVAQPGDAAKGTEAEEERVRKLKALAAAAGTSRAFNASTGPERKLDISTRLARLEGLLNDLGLQTTKGSLPSLAKAKEVGQRRELAKEMAEISGVPIVEGLRGGKRISAVGVSSGSEDDEDGDSDGPAKKKTKKAPAKKFFAFLGQSDSD